MEKLILFKYDHFRNYLDSYAIMNNTTLTAIVEEIGLSNSVMKNSIAKFERNENLFDFKKEKYTKYGVLTENNYLKLCKAIKLDPNEMFVTSAMRNKTERKPQENKHDYEDIVKKLNNIEEALLLILEALNK